MTAIAISESNLREFKSALHNLFDEVKSSHLSEAVAASLGRRTHAALLADMKKADPANPEVVLLDDDAFFAKLANLGTPIVIEDWLGFWEIDAKCLINTDPVSEVENKYNTARKRAWRNMLVSAINAGIDQNLFSVLPGTNRWPGYVEDSGRQEAYLYTFTFGDGIPAAASVADIGFEELSIHVALWPTGESIKAANAGFYAGDAFATGWLERDRGAWLQFSPELLNCRRKRLSLVEAINVRPKGFGDRGRVLI